MTVMVRLFAGLAQQFRTTSLQLDMAEGTRAGAVKSELQRLFPDVPWPPRTLMAVNQEYAREDTELHAGDEVAVIPPVSGG